MSCMHLREQCLGAFGGLRRRQRGRRYQDPILSSDSRMDFLDKEGEVDMFQAGGHADIRIASWREAD
jgi:hypothetical protein